MAYMIAYDYKKYYPLMIPLQVPVIQEWIIYFEESVTMLANYKIIECDSRYKIKKTIIDKYKPSRDDYDDD